MRTTTWRDLAADSLPIITISWNFRKIALGFFRVMVGLGDPTHPHSCSRPARTYPTAREGPRRQGPRRRQRASGGKSPADGVGEPDVVGEITGLWVFTVQQ